MAWRLVIMFGYKKPQVGLSRGVRDRRPGQAMTIHTKLAADWTRTGYANSWNHRSGIRV